MTDDELREAARTLRRLIDRRCDCDDCEDDRLSILRALVERETEACAKVVESPRFYGNRADTYAIAAAIRFRARSK